MTSADLLHRLAASSEAELETREYVLQWLCRHIGELGPSSKPKHRGMDQGQSSVFSYWDPKELGVPSVVELCLESQRHFFRDRFNLLDPQNLSKFVSADVLGVAESRSISLTHFSDLVRLSVLQRHGGMWLDATVLITGSSPEDIDRANEFLFLRPSDPFLVSVWCIKAVQDSYIVDLWLQSLLQFWKDHSTLVHYFQMHFIFEALVILDPDFESRFMSLVAHSYLRPHLLQEALRTSSEESFESLNENVGQSWIHKLSYKILSDRSIERLRLVLSHP